MKDFLARLLSRKLLITLGAIFAAVSDSGLGTTRIGIIAGLAGLYVIAEAALDASNKKPLLDDAERGLALGRSLTGGAAPAPSQAPVVVNVSSTPPPPLPREAAASSPEPSPAPPPEGG